MTKRKSKFKCLQLYNETFRQTFWIFDNKEEFIKMADELDMPQFKEDLGAGSTGWVYVDGVMVIFFWYQDKYTLIHEMEHAKNIMLGDRGHQGSYDNDEVDCYLMEWLYYKIDKGISYNGKDITATNSTKKRNKGR